MKMMNDGDEGMITKIERRESNDCFLDLLERKYFSYWTWGRTITG